VENRDGLCLQEFVSKPVDVKEPQSLRGKAVVSTYSNDFYSNRRYVQGGRGEEEFNFTAISGTRDDLNIILAVIKLRIEFESHRVTVLSNIELESESGND
jgi:hypothetical protein